MTSNTLTERFNKLITEEIGIGSTSKAVREFILAELERIALEVEADQVFVPLTWDVESKPLNPKLFYNNALKHAVFIIRSAGESLK